MRYSFRARALSRCLIVAFGLIVALGSWVALGSCAGFGSYFGTTVARAEISADKLPDLTGRVVDGANVLQPDDKSALTAKLKDLEYQSGIQFVVATVPTLQGEEIEPYANALFRKWKLGQKDKNNGLLFIIAPKERKIRFEVGYGLEGVLTDALTKLILRNAVGPKLKANDYPGGIKAGVDEAIAVMTTDKSSWEKRPALAPRSQGVTSATAPDDGSGALGGFIILGIILVVVVIVFRNRRSIDWSSLFTGMLLNSVLGGGSSGSRNDGSSSGSNDSFSGGGGDSGGGGASDDY